MNGEKQFNDGDVVTLRSGGPKMTVNGYMEFGEVHCQWFEGNELKKGFFAEDSLAVLKHNGALDTADQPRPLNTIQDSASPGAAV